VNNEHAEPTCTHLGGQAVIEGVMMRGKYSWAVSARDIQGTIHSQEHDLTPAEDRPTWMKWPVVRGCVALVDSLKLGTKALTISAEMASMEGGGDGTDEADESIDTGVGSTGGGEPTLGRGETAFALVAGFALAIGIFVVAPTLLTNLVVGPITRGQLLWNVVYGAMSLVAFFLYVWLIGFMPDMKRIFAYHGAEHKVISAVEHGAELTPENCMNYPRLHVRCGTSFLLMVAVISIVVFTFVPIRAAVMSLGIENAVLVTLIVMASRILLLPLVAGLAYEVTVKWAGKRPDNPLVKVMLWPGVQMQRLTTAEPTIDMVEVAIASTNLVLEREAAQRLTGILPTQLDYDALREERIA